MIRKGMASISADEKRWRAESDARTMAEYEEILQDSRLLLQQLRNRQLK